MQVIRRKQLSIGFLTYYYKMGCITMMNGAFQMAQRNQVNIIGFGCDITTKAYRYDVSTLFEFIKNQNFDGLLFLGYLQVTGINFLEFRREFKHLPLFSIGTGYPDIPNIYMDGTSYYQELLIHLIEVHGCRRIALFCPTMWDDRIRIYTDVMQSYGIYDPQLILRAEDLTIEELELALRAKKGLSILLDERKANFDAIALMYSFEYPLLLNELKKRGLRVPEDVKIIGYEDLDEAKYCSPPLTTVYYPFWELGYYGCENFIKMLTGRNNDIPFSTRIPGRTVLRRSCGCLPHSAKLAILDKKAVPVISLEKYPDKAKNSVVQELVRFFPDPHLDAEKLVHAVFTGLETKNNALFLNALKEELKVNSKKTDEAPPFEDVVSCLRRLILPHFDSATDILWLENLFHQARILITANVIKIFGNQDYQTSRFNFLLQFIGQELITTFNTEKLMDILEITLQRIHIPSCYVFLFNRAEKDFDNCITALQFVDYKRIHSDMSRITSIKNLPATALPRHRCYAMLFHLLGIEYEKFGVVLFEAGPFDLGIYQSLTIQLSTALKSTILLDKVAATNQELKTTQAELIAKAHQAGMADIATDTLHNIGNVLNSIYTSVHLLQNVLDTSPVNDLERAATLLDRSDEDLEHFIGSDPKGKKLMQLLLKLEQPFDEVHKQIHYHLKRLQEKINLIDEIIMAQQTYAGARSILEEMDVMAIIEDTVKMLSSTLEKNHIEIIRDLHTVPKVNVQKNKLFHVLVNLINNAQEAMADIPADKRRLTLSLTSDDHYVYIHVTDTGHGMAAEVLPALFSGEFTTKKGRRGFGLLCCANYMAEMGGKISASSSGPGTGATFTVSFAWNQK